MNSMRILCLVLLAPLLFTNYCSEKKKPKVLNRAILGEELKFGRKAAEFELWNEAIFRWEKVTRADPANSQAVNNLAVAYESIGDYERAEQLYQRAIELDEDSDEIRKNYKRFLSFYKRHQRQLERDRQKVPDGKTPAAPEQEEKTEANSGEGGP